MVDPFGFRPFGGGILSGGPAPFGFSPPAPQTPYASTGGSGRGDDSATAVTPTPAHFRCLNRDCGAHSGGAFYPLCQDCNDQLKSGNGPIVLENGDKIFKPIRPGDPYIPPFHRR